MGAAGGEGDYQEVQVEDHVVRPVRVQERGVQKPTNILTNSEDWTTKGRTRNGRCKAGCALGDDETPTTVPSSKKAVKNTLEPELVKEMFGAIRMSRGRRRETEEKGGEEARAGHRGEE